MDAIIKMEDAGDGAAREGIAARIVRKMIVSCMVKVVGLLVWLVGWNRWGCSDLTAENCDNETVSSDGD